jgi:bifunctional non-homologous end joining protein LigD
MAVDTLLKTYREKRNFAETQEPSGEAAAAKGEGLAFVIQKHDATRLHYDFRVEWEGVLKSWAVTRGPSYDTSDKRLAVRTEDHPMDYGDFEGTIPKGSYGGGTVMLWDRGTWEPQGDAAAELEAGNLKMILHGEKLKGKWALIRMKPRPGEKRENWLLIKEKDELADPGHDVLKEDKSVKTGRSLDEIAAGHEEWTRKTVSPADAEAARAIAKAGSKKKPGAKAKPEKTDETEEPALAAKPKAARKAGSKLSAEPDQLAEPAPAKATGKRTAKPAKGMARSTKVPEFRPLQLATLVDAAPSGGDWLNEMKYDGYRILIAIGGGKAKIYTRNALDWTDRFAFLLPAIAELPCDSAVIDGELVAFDADGKTDFSTLQQHLKDGGALACFCFDLLMLDGVEMEAKPLTERKQALEALLKGHEQPVLLYSEHVAGSGPAMLRQICAAGHEGIIAKRADAPYRAGRSTGWVKAKCTKRQEFVIGGFSPSDKKGRAFSSILIGVNEDGKFLYRGRVGSGFDDDALEDLAKRFKTIARDKSAFADLPRPIARTSKYVEPKLVAEIDFAEFTADGQVRHGVFKGLREDKPAEAVVDEKAKPTKKLAAAAAVATETASEKPPEAPREAVSRGAKAVVTKVAGITLSHPERVVFASQAVTKLDLAEYYEAVSERMLTYAGGRPLSLVRCPGGRQKACFFQKHDSGGFPDGIKKIPIAEKDGGTADYLYVDDAAGLVAAVQMNTLEFHIWGADIRDVEKPERIVFDFDPDESLTFADVKSAAFDMRDRLKALGLESFALVTGGKGVHVVVPLSRKQAWPEVKGFARDMAYLLEREEPTRFVATMSKAKRKGRIFVDWLRNERGSTAVAPFSTRSRENAPVAVPVGWDELQELEAANLFHPKDVLARLAEPDPWAGYADVKQSLTKAILKKVAG